MPENRSPYEFIKRVGLKILRFITHGTNLQASRRLFLYLGIAFSALLIIWLPVSYFLLKVPPSYYCNWSLILPGGGSGHAVSLESVGQATATAASPYTSHSVDPKVNYKAIASSNQVLQAAAKSIGMTKEAFGKPVIKLVDQTALIQFRHSAKTGKVAYNKAEALRLAFLRELERLRNDEQQRKEEATNDMLDGFTEKLRQAQQQILDYQTHSSIVSLEQFSEITLGLERAKATLREMSAKYRGVQSQLATLQSTLALDPQTASAVLRLQTDPVYLQLMLKYAEASAALTEASAKWGPKNISVITAKDIHTMLHRAILARVLEIAEQTRVDPTTLTQIGGTGDKNLFSQLVELHGAAAGMAREIAELERSIAEQQHMLESSTRDASNLEDLKRKLQVATAVFTTALAKIDLGKSDRFTTYPMVQLFSAPIQPEKPDTIQRKLAMAGAILGTLFIVFGLILLWIRKPYLQKILKSV